MRARDEAAPDDSEPAPGLDLPAGLLVTALVLLTLAGALVVLALLPPVADEIAIAPAVGVAVTVVVHMVIAVGLAGGAAGLVLRASAGWWAAAVSAGANALYQGKLLAFYARAIRWSHPRADALAWEVGLRYGLPAAVSLALLVALLHPRMRTRFGLSATPYARPPRRVGGPSSAGSSRRSSRP